MKKKKASERGEKKGEIMKEKKKERGRRNTERNETHKKLVIPPFASYFILSASNDFLPFFLRSFLPFLFYFSPRESNTKKRKSHFLILHPRKNFLTQRKEKEGEKERKNWEKRRKRECVVREKEDMPFFKFSVTFTSSGRLSSHGKRKEDDEEKKLRRRRKEESSVSCLFGSLESFPSNETKLKGSEEAISKKWIEST